MKSFIPCNLLYITKNKSFPENFEFKVMNKQKQPEKKQFTTASSLVVFYTNNFSDLIDKNIGSEREQ